MGTETTYRDAGVDIDAGNRAVALMKDAVAATQGPEVLAGVGAFGGLFSLSGLAGMTDPVLAASADGVGTKVRLATRMPLAWLGQDLVNHCVDDILVQGARPSSSDYVASSKLDPVEVAEIVSMASVLCIWLCTSWRRNGRNAGGLCRWRSRCCRHDRRRRRSPKDHRWHSYRGWRHCLGSGLSESTHQWLLADQARLG